MAGCDCQLEGPVLGPGRDGAHGIRVYDTKVQRNACRLQAGDSTHTAAHTMQAVPVCGVIHQFRDDLLHTADAENNRGASLV